MLRLLFPNINNRQQKKEHKTNSKCKIISVSLLRSFINRFTSFQYIFLCEWMLRLLFNSFSAFYGSLKLLPLNFLQFTFRYQTCSEKEFPPQLYDCSSCCCARNDTIEPIDFHIERNYFCNWTSFTQLKTEENFYEKTTFWIREQNFCTEFVWFSGGKFLTVDGNILIRSEGKFTYK